ncbi:MAG: DUF2635 domain-containing protein [Gallionellaceae bacterium]|nr:DUF2635 domain-containing protein [Gallionellaceae bacterium]
MQVKAAAGLKVPMEDKPHDYITDAESVDVPESAYYQRRISDGDLIEQLANRLSSQAGESLVMVIDAPVKTKTKGAA